MSDDLGNDGGSRWRTTAGDDVGDNVGDVDDGDDGGDDGGDDAGDDASEGDGGDAGREGGGAPGGGHGGSGGGGDGGGGGCILQGLLLFIVKIFFVCGIFLGKNWRMPVHRFFHLENASTVLIPM